MEAVVISWINKTYREMVQCFFSPSFLLIIIRSSYTNPSFVFAVVVPCCYGRMAFQKGLWASPFWSSTSATRGWGTELPKASKSYFADTSLGWRLLEIIAVSLWASFSSLKVFSAYFMGSSLRSRQAADDYAVYSLGPLFFAVISRLRNYTT